MKEKHRLDLEVTSQEYFDLLSAIGTRRERLSEYIEQIPGEDDLGREYSSASELGRLTTLEASIREAHTRVNLPTMHAAGVRI